MYVLSSALSLGGIVSSFDVIRANVSFSAASKRRHRLQLFIIYLMINLTTEQGGTAALKPSEVTTKPVNSDDATAFLFSKSL